MEGWTVVASTGTIQRHPAASLYLEACSMANRLAVEFGMTPSSRTRVKVPPKEGGNNPLETIPGG